MQSNIKWFREIAENKKQDYSYEPLCLWLIPIYLRTRQRYYDEATSKIKKLIDDLWNKVRGGFASRDEFEKSEVVESIWARYAPYSWSLNDVIGWIDVRLSIPHRQIKLALFLPSKRVSRNLQEKMFVFQYMEVIDVPNFATNDELQSRVMETLHTMIQNPRIKRFFIDLAACRRTRQELVNGQMVNLKHEQKI